MKKILIEFPAEGEVVTYDEMGNMETITVTDTRDYVSQIVEDMEEVFNFYLHGGNMLNIEAKSAHDGSVKISHDVEDNAIVININNADYVYAALSDNPDHKEINALQVGDYLGMVDNG